MDIGLLAQYGGPAAGMVAILGYWLKRSLDKIDSLELAITTLNGEVKEDLRGVLPILNESSRILKEIGEDGNQEVLEHLWEIKKKIKDVQCHAKEES